MDNKTIKKLITTGESDAVEFKRARGGVPADFWPSYSSFANTDGGVIVLGVRENEKHERESEGLADVEKIKGDPWNAANNPDEISANVLFNESVYSVKVDDKQLVIVEVPRAERVDRPVFVGSDVFKGTYRRNGEGDRSGMGISSLYGVWKQEKFAQPSIAESYEPDRTKVTVEYESEAVEVGAETSEVKEKIAEVGVETQEVKEKIEGEKKEFDILMGAYRNDFRENAHRVYRVLANDSGMDTKRLSQSLGISESGIWRAVRAMKDVGLLVREGGDKGGRWIVKHAGK